MPSEEEELQQLEAEGIGEGDFDGDHEVPAEAIEAHEALEFAYAEQNEEEGV
jgi:hypothetical protein